MTSKWKYKDTSTDAVYNSFVQLRADKQAAHRAFWEWMESIFKREREAERERITKLLEAELVKLLPEGERQKNHFEGLCAAIELIKGEQ